MSSGAKERLDIERLVVWALVEQGLGFVGKERVPNPTAEDYGGQIDFTPVQGLPSIALWTSDDALAIKDGIEALPGEMARAVMQYGRAGIRPDWAPEGYGEPEPLLDKRGRPRVEWENPRARKGAKRVLLDHWAHSRRKATVDFCRLEWAVWWRGLELLVPVVNARMSEHVATGPAVAKEPWLAPLQGELPAAAQRRLKAYADRDEFAPEGVSEGQVTIEQLREHATSEVRAVATEWGPGTSGVAVAEREERLAEAAREALAKGLKTVADSVSQQAEHGRS